MLFRSVDGKSSWTEEEKQKQQSETNAENKIIYIFEKDKFKAYAGDQLIEGTYTWMDDNNIETASTSDGKTEKSTAKVEVSADKLTFYSEEKSDTTTKKQVTILKKYTGELPKVTAKK